jgi:hypothetical protein
MDNKPKNPLNNLNGGQNRPSILPVKQLIFWAVLIFVGPLLVMWFNSRNNARTTVLTASDFEELLLGKHIHTAVVVEQSSTSIQIIRGKFWPRDRQIGREEDLAS